MEKKITCVWHWLRVERPEFVANVLVELAFKSIGCQPKPSLTRVRLLRSLAIVICWAFDRFGFSFWGGHLWFNEPPDQFHNYPWNPNPRQTRNDNQQKFFRMFNILFKCIIQFGISGYRQPQMDFASSLWPRNINICLHPDTISKGGVGEWVEARGGIPFVLRGEDGVGKR